MIDAFKTIIIPVNVDGKETQIEVPFTVELLRKVEDTTRKATGKRWFCFKKSDQSIIEIFEEFCKPYFPADFDFSQVQPTFCGLFFWHVRNELQRSVENWHVCMTSIVESDERTEEKTVEEQLQSE